MPLAQTQIREAIEQSGLSKRIVCLHASLKSFGRVDGGADAVIDAFLEAGCTLIVPSFFYDSQAAPPAGRSIPQNGMDPEWIAGHTHAVGYDPDANQISRAEMGAIPARLIERPGRVRGNHPCDPFAGLGPLAAGLIADQSPLNVFGPFKRVYAGPPARLLLAGVGLTAATAVHFAEELSGRRLFRRWGRLAGGMDIEVEEGGCSEGFENLTAAVASLQQRIVVGGSVWRIYPFREFIDAAVSAIRQNPAVTHCSDPS
ncbi:MAG: AAC(3) family N-acetyltransferase, partial [Anaerolineales bacterium]